MERQICKGVRLPVSVVQRIERITAADGSTFSQFIRTAALRAIREHAPEIGTLERPPRQKKEAANA